MNPYQSPESSNGNWPIMTHVFFNIAIMPLLIFGAICLSLQCCSSLVQYGVKVPNFLLEAKYWIGKHDSLCIFSIVGIFVFGVVASISTFHLTYKTNFTLSQELLTNESFFLGLENAAGMCVQNFWEEMQETQDVIHKFKFVGTCKPCYLGDLIDIVAEITRMSQKSAVVKTKAYRGAKESRELVAEAEFVFFKSKPDLILYDYETSFAVFPGKTNEPLPKP